MAALATPSFGQTIFPQWPALGGGAQHNCISVISPISNNTGVWAMSVDANPPIVGGIYNEHYATPCITPHNNAVVALRNSDGSYTIEGLAAKDGTTVWSHLSTYIQPSVRNLDLSVGPSLLTAKIPLGPPIPGPAPIGIGVPPFSPSAVWAESGGRVSMRSNCDGSNGTFTTHAFFGDANYNAAAATYDATVKICTPITVGPDGSLYFGYFVEGANPLGLTSGLAVMRPNGLGTYVSAATVSNDVAIDRVTFNAAPAISMDGGYVYVVVSGGYSGKGYIVRLNARTLLPTSKVLMKDPVSLANATISCDETSSPTVAIDNTVLMGVLESTLNSNDGRGYLLHYSTTLGKEYYYGPYGADCIPTIVPAYTVPANYTDSPFLVATVYNDIAGQGAGQGINGVLLSDPYDPEIGGGPAMTPLLEFVNPDPDLVARGNGYLNAVEPFCTNAMPVDNKSSRTYCAAYNGTVWVIDWSNQAVVNNVQTYGLQGQLPAPIAVAPCGSLAIIFDAQLHVDDMVVTP